MIKRAILLSILLCCLLLQTQLCLGTTAVVGTLTVSPSETVMLGDTVTVTGTGWSCGYPYTNGCRYYYKLDNPIGTQVIYYSDVFYGSELQPNIDYTVWHSFSNSCYEEPYQYANYSGVTVSLIDWQCSDPQYMCGPGSYAKSVYIQFQCLDFVFPKPSINNNHALTHKYRLDDSYPDPHQTTDHRVQFEGKLTGWPGDFSGRTISVRLIDPPDSSSYANSQNGNDNHGGGGTLSASTFTTDSAGNFYGFLDITDKNAGDNYQLEASAGSFDPQHGVFKSGVLDASKRFYVERDKMFMKGGLLARDGSIGDNKVTIYNWAKLPNCRSKPPSGGQSYCYQVALFDAYNFYGQYGEGPHEEPYISYVKPSTVVSNAYDLFLVNANMTPYTLQKQYRSSPIDFSNGLSAGVGVIGSGFYEADTSRMIAPFYDAFVEPVQLASPNIGPGAVPYVHWATDPSAAYLDAFSRIWWDSNNQYPSNRNNIHLIGVENVRPSVPNGIGSTVYLGNYMTGTSFIEVQKLLDNSNVSSQNKSLFNQYATVHELTHNFSIFHSVDGTYHCQETSIMAGQECVMHAAITAYPGKNPYFCAPHLLLGGATIAGVTTSIRDQTDEVP